MAVPSKETFPERALSLTEPEAPIVRVSLTSEFAQSKERVPLLDISPFSIAVPRVALSVHVPEAHPPDIPVPFVIPVISPPELASTTHVNPAVPLS